MRKEKCDPWRRYPYSSTKSIFRGNLDISKHVEKQLARMSETPYVSGDD